MPKVSVIYVTNRFGGIDILAASLRKQTLQDFELVLVDELYGLRNVSVKDHLRDIDLNHIRAPQRDSDDIWNLSKCYNEALRQAKGEIAISLQDYIWVPGDGIQKFVTAIEELGDVLITGVGHKAAYPGREQVKNPEGRITVFEKPFEDRPEGIKERDGRIDGRQELVETNYSFFELNWSAFPMKIAREIGGFDEEMDKRYGCENINFALRAHLAGYRIFMDKTNECGGIFHQEIFPRPDNWNSMHANQGFYAARAQEFLAGRIPFDVKAI